MYMRKSQSKDYYIGLAIDTDNQNRKLRNENQKITQSIFGILKTKEKLKEDVEREVEADMDRLKQDCANEIEDATNELQRDRNKMLAALGIDEHEWERISWKY